MSNGNVMIVHLIAGLIKFIQLRWINVVLLYKNVSSFLNRMIHLAEILTLELTCLIMQQKQISKIFHILILQVFVLKSNLASLKTKLDKLDIDTLVPVWFK